MPYDTSLGAGVLHMHVEVHEPGCKNLGEMPPAWLERSGGK